MAFTSLQVKGELTAQVTLKLHALLLGRQVFRNENRV